MPTAQRARFIITNMLDPAVLLADQVADRASLSPKERIAVGLAWIPSLCSSDTQ